MPPSGSGLSIRPATMADAPVLAATIVAAFEQYRGGLDPPSGALDETPDSIRHELESAYGGALAVFDGHPIGCVLFRPEGPDLYFGRLSVLPAHRGRGVAAALVRAVEAEAARRGCQGGVLGVRIALPENQEVFRRLGYTEIARHAHAGYNLPTWIEM
ncbi:MAG: GNAT family N-acetyltransferase, partial [Dehalococcoidia bacterium]